jgi:hypothetical protein
MKTIKMISAILFTLLVAIPAHADDYIDHQYSNNIVPALTQNGFQILDTTTTPLINQGDSHTFVITPLAGVRVALVGIGDWDSNDVDLHVYCAETGRLIASDTCLDDTPVCEFTSSGVSYRVTISVPDTDAPAYVKFVYATR